MELHYLMVLVFFSSAVYAEEMLEECKNITKCQVDQAALSKAEDDGQMDTMKSILSTAISCLQPALDKCREAAGDDDSQFSQIQAQLKGYKETLENLQGPGMGVPSGGPQGPKPTCDQLDTCITGLAGYLQKAGNEGGNSMQLCEVLVPAISCVQMSLDDCNKNEAVTVPDEQMKNAQKIIKEAETAVTQHCPGGAAGGVGMDLMPGGDDGDKAKYNVSIDAEVPQDPKCWDGQQCMAGLEATNNFDKLSESEKAKVCKYIPPKLECFDKALKDCVKKNLPETELKEMKKGLEMGRKLFKQNCGDGDGVAVTQISWLALVVGFLAAWQVQRQA